MAQARAALTAILGPTNTGKTHLAVERMTAHASGMMGFPLRLLAREIYDRVVRIKGEGQVALITGEERIEPPGARYYCCTVESMPVDREFAFVAVDEAQLGADPERGHIFTDRLLHARGYAETMILGSESLAPLIRLLLPEAEIITRPRFSTLSYGGVKKLSRLPKRSAIVAFSAEQVYAVAETLRRLRGGCAVVMGALSPRTRNAQVEMFQSGEVDYLVATDAIGMGLNLDVAHVAFAGLHKFDGAVRRRLTIAEMAQIAGRAGRHQKDGSFGTLGGESGEMTPEEILAIEDHKFAPLDWLYWREAEPDCHSLQTLIADLELRPERQGLRAAPEVIDLDVLKRLAAMPDAAALARGAARVRRIWEVACLPDFRQLGAEAHSRFVAGLWRYLGQDMGHLPHDYVAGEIARLDNMQGDVATLSGRIAAARTWTYIGHRADWLANPPAIAERARAVEEKLSDALHQALRQRFVDRRTTLLMRGAGKDSALLPVVVDEDNRVLVDGEDIGRLDGFTFRVDAKVRADDYKLFQAAAQRHLAALLRQKAREVKMADDSEFSMAADGDRRPAIYFRGDLLGHLVRGKSLLTPSFRPVRAVGGLEGDALRDVTTRAESWIEAQLERHVGGIVALHKLSQEEGIDGNVRALAVQLAESGGIAGRPYLADALAALPKEARGAARKNGIVFGALDIFHHAALKPGAAKWRAALFSARDDRPMPDLPPESAVHLKEWQFASAADCRNAGYRRAGDEHLRIDLAERVIKKAHEARGEAQSFAMDMSFVTSLGLGEEGLLALMQQAGFKKTAAPAVSYQMVGGELVADATPSTGADALDAVADAPDMLAPETGAPETVSPEVEKPEVEAVTAESAPPPVEVVEGQAPAAANISHWRWVGIRKARPFTPRGEARDGGAGSANRKQGKGRKAGGKGKAPSGQFRNRDNGNGGAEKTARPPSALALQLAALQELQQSKTR